MKKSNVLKKGIIAFGLMVCAGMFVACTEEEIAPSTERNQLIGDDVIDADVLDGDDNGNTDGNSNADGPRGKDHDIIDIDINTI